MSPDPPAALEPDSFASTLYDALEPLAANDEANDWALLTLCNAIGLMFQDVDELVRDTPDGPGWSQLVDVNRCPSAALPWLGQLVGVRIPVGATDAQARALIASHSGFDRGTGQSIIDTAKATLTGKKTVVLRERDPAGADPPYALTVLTYTSETPSQATTLAAILSRKPAGLVLNYVVSPGQDWVTLKTNNATWNAVKAKYPDWIACRTDKP